MYYRQGASHLASLPAYSPSCTLRVLLSSQHCDRSTRALSISSQMLFHAAGSAPALRHSTPAVAIRPNLRPALAPSAAPGPGHKSRDSVATSVLSLAAVPIEAVYIGTGILAGIGALVGWQMSSSSSAQKKDERAPEPAEELPPPIPRKNAVLVLGATGRLGRRVVQQVRSHASHRSPAAPDHPNINCGCTILCTLLPQQRPLNSRPAPSATAFQATLLLTH